MWQAMQADCWQGRVDAEEGELGRRWHQVVRAQAEVSPSLALLGLASDVGVRINQGRPGAAAGPAALRQALASLAHHHPWGIVDLGDVIAGDDLPGAQAEYAQRAAAGLQAGHRVIGLGGGHEMAWGSFMAVQQALNAERDRRVAVINFDAHFDVRKPSPQASSGTGFYQMAEWCRSHGVPFEALCIGLSEANNTKALFERAKQLGLRWVCDVDCEAARIDECINALLARADVLLVTVCLDVLPASVAPGVSAPAGLGLPPQQLLRSLQSLAAACRAQHVQWCAADVAELNPEYDPDGRTARVAARVVWTLANALMAEHSHER